MRSPHISLFVVFLIIFSSCQSGRMPSQEQNTQLLDIQIKHVPVFPEHQNNPIAMLLFTGENSGKELTSATFYFSDQTPVNKISALNLAFLNEEGEPAGNVMSNAKINSTTIKMEGSLKMDAGDKPLALIISLQDDTGLLETITLKGVKLTLEDGTTIVKHLDEKAATWRLARVVREAGQDGAHTYRIPGLVTTNEGTLIAVYDIRYNNSKDLQEDIDVGLSRSTDGGQTWEPMQVIIDMGEWGGLPEYLNGVGDPSVLYDHTTGTIWVAGLWTHGFSRDQMAWWASKPGMSPEETGQVVLVKSTDDGLTWSEPINITQQIKDSAWQLVLQGPGRGITLEDGTLVFPAQFKADIGEKALDGGQYTSHSTIIYSQDGGKTWHTGTGAKPNTTEAQVVQLSDGSLMLNMRDDLNRKVKDEHNGRAVATTTDLGKTWSIHPSSNSALIEPNCMAGLIATDMEWDGEQKQVLFFSNPADKYKRINMTLKTSLDEGMTWPEKYHILLNENGGFGYSCLTMVDDQTVGILYEGVRNLYFQKVGAASPNLKE